MTEAASRAQYAARRTVLCAGLVGAVGACAAVTGCSMSAVPYDANDEGQAPGADDVTASASNMAAGTSGTAAAGAAGSAAGSAAPSSGGQTGTVLGTTADIPVGGGMVFTAAKVVVTQPTKGVFKAFSAVCTHVGCICNQVADGTINCPCHGSKFKITDGAVVAGPAPSPLPAAPVTFSDGKILLT